MSLLINALKKYRQESTASLTPESGGDNKDLKKIKIKKTLIFGLIIVIVILLTVIGSFLIFKHIEKQRIANVMQSKTAKIQQIKAALAKNAGGAASSAPAEGGGLRARLAQKMQQQNDQSAPAPIVSSAAATTDTVVPATVAAPVVVPVVVPVAAPVVAAATARPRAVRGGATAPRGSRLAARAAATTTASDDDQASPASSSSSDTAAAVADTPTNDESVASGDDTSSSNNSDSSDDEESSDSNDSQSNKVNIKVVADPTGTNDPSYQKALGFVQLNQYDKALPLLKNNDELLLKTQGMSGLLLARIYLMTGQFNLAEDVADNALMLHAGSDMQLLSLKAQALFMQKRYQEAIELLSSQSPDLSTFPEYYSLLADAYMHIGQARNAVSIFQQIVSRFPDSADYWLGLAVAYQKTGEGSSALVAYRRAAQLSRDDPQVSLFISQQLNILQTI